MILSTFTLGELLLRISRRIINALRSYIKHSKECFSNTEKWAEKTRRSLLLSVWISDETLFLVFEILLLKLINYSCSQKPINDLHLGQVDESSMIPNETPDETPPGFHLR